MFWLVSGSLSSSISRFLNYEMGRKDYERLKRVFSMSLNIMLILAFIVILLSETFGLWFLSHKMNIPTGRENAAFWVFQFSVITVISGFLVVPYNASIVAHERMRIYAYLGIFEAIIRLLIALALAFGHFKTDRLILYALLWLIATILMQVTAALFCRRSFSECRFRKVFDRKLFTDMFSYAGWSFMGSIAGTFSGQGINVALNTFFGTIVNAARGIADTVSRSVAIFVNNFTVAINPQIAQSYAAGDNEYMKTLVLKGTRFSFFILFLFAFPLILETRFVLFIWLGQVPQYSVNFIRLILLINLIEVHGIYFGMAQRATGVIKRLQLITSFFVFLIYPFSLLFLKFGFPPEVTYIVNIVMSIINILVTLHIANSTFQFTFKSILLSTYVKMWLVAVISMVLPIFIHFLLPYGWIRFFLCTVANIISTVITIWIIGCNASEKKSIINTVQSRLPFINRIQLQ